MRCRNILPVLAALLTLTMVLAPVLSEDTGATPGGVVVYSDTRSVDLASNSSISFQVAFTNTSDLTYDLRVVYEHSMKEYSVSLTIEEFILAPGEIKTVLVTVTSVKYAENLLDTLTIGAEFHSMTPGATEPNTISVDVRTSTMYNDTGDFNKILGKIDTPLPAPFDSPLVTAVITGVLWFIISLVMSLFFVAIINWFMFRRTRDLDEDGMRKIHKMWKFTFAIIMIYGTANTMNVYGLDTEIVGTFRELSSFLFVILGGIIIWDIVRVEIDVIGKGLNQESRYDPSIIPLVQTLWKIFVISGTAIASLAVYGVDLVAIVTGLGLLSTGLSFGAKNIINQFLNGTILLAERPFVPGDKVRVGNSSTTLIVRKVGYMTCQFRNWTNEEIITAPNSTLMENPMTNITRDNTLYKVYDYYSISYTSDITRAKEVMIECTLAHDDVVTDPKLGSPDVRFDEINRNCINLRLAFVVRDHENYGIIAGEIRYRIFKRFGEEGIDIPYDQYSINLVRAKRMEGEHTSS